MGDVQAGPEHTGPALDGTDDQALLQALRNLWPILNKASRQQAIDIAKELRG